MLNLLVVHFDNHIPNWRTSMEEITCHILILVMEGEIHYSINGVDYIGEKGDFIFIPRYSLRSGKNSQEGTHQKYTILFRTDLQIETGIPFIDQGHFIKLKISNFQYVSSRCNRLFEEMRKRDNFSPIISVGITHELLGILAQELEKPELTPMKLKYAQTVQSYLLSHYREPIQIGVLADLINRTPNYATALFKEVYGYTPIKYMHYLRVMEARNLLLHSDMTISSIAYYLGYYDTSYFFKIFKKSCGMSPTEFITQGKFSSLMI
jgi:YesN/AraC family two-component response regulator